MFLDNIPNSFHPAKYILKPPYLSAIRVRLHILTGSHISSMALLSKINCANLREQSLYEVMKTRITDRHGGSV